MIAIYFVYGLAFFSLGFAVALESKRKSDLPLGNQLAWLAAFGITHAIVEWADMLLLTEPGEPYNSFLNASRTVLLPVSTILLIRFGAGLIHEAGPLPRWVLYLPVIFTVPVALLVGFAIISATADPLLATDVWTRYLLYFSGCILASLGFIRQRKLLKGANLQEARHLMLGAAIVFAINAVIAGLIVPRASYGIAPWLNYESVMDATGIPVQVWRMVSAVLVTVFVIRSLDIFETERIHELDRLQSRQMKAEIDLHEERERAQKSQLVIQTRATRAAQEWAGGLIDISRQIANMEGVNDVLRHIVRQAKFLSDSDCVYVGLLDEGEIFLEIKCHAIGNRIHTLSAGYKVDDALIMQYLGTCRSHRYPGDFNGREISWHCPTLARGIQAAAIVPFQFDGQLVGGLWTGRFRDKEFDLNEIAILESLADQAVIALQHALMASRIQSMAVVDERTRIAREMHDGLAQVLGYLSMQVQALEALTRQGNVEGVLEELRNTRENIKIAHADVRENILSLRTTLAGESGLIPALDEYISEFGVQYSCDTKLIVGVDGIPNISPLAEVQLVRIVQEALSNIRKHAQANFVSVSLQTHNGSLQVIIADDGIGFSSTDDHHQFGLQTMLERAESVGGSLSVTSHPGDGTEIGLYLPLIPE